MQVQRLAGDVGLAVGARLRTRGGAPVGSGTESPVRVRPAVDPGGVLGRWPVHGTGGRDRGRVASGGNVTVQAQEGLGEDEYGLRTAVDVALQLDGDAVPSGQ